MFKKVSKRKDVITKMSDELILACKAEFIAERKLLARGEKDFIKRASSAVYFDYLVHFNRTGCFRETSEAYNIRSTNMRSYLQTAFKRVKYFLREKKNEG